MARETSEMYIVPIKDNFFDIVHPEGYVTCAHDAELDWFHISMVEVKERSRRQGIGKLLVERAKEEGEKSGASLIWASIISRESLEVFRAVFGEDAIDIESEGDFEGEGGQRTRAGLEYWPKLVTSDQEVPPKGTAFARLFERLKH